MDQEPIERAGGQRPGRQAAPSSEDRLPTLYGILRADLERFLLARTGDPAEAEEIAQELWLRVRSARGVAVANGRAYLFRIAQNLVIDRVRERQRRARRERLWQDERAPITPNALEPRDPALNAEEDLLEREERAALAAAIAALPPAARRAFELHKIDGLAHAEVALKLGISRSGVEKHMAVAMRHLRRTLLE